jgi:octaprenyl-diphosphate synthase
MSRRPTQQVVAPDPIRSGDEMQTTLPELSQLTPVLNSFVPRSQPTSPFAAVATDIAESERIFAETLAKYRSPVSSMVSHLKHYRGKRLRPALLLLTAKACGGVFPTHHILSAVVEMIHTATLVHDDVLDEADTRRHVPTFNAEWGNKVSILFGDMLFTHAFHLTGNVDVRACRLIGETTNRVCAGELKQICNRGNLYLTQADYFEIVDGKTAALTEVCGQLGALYAGASKETADQLGVYGRCLGIAFQIADDLMDLTGSETKAGKTLGTDLAQGKLTLPLIHALNTLPVTSADQLRRLLTSSDENKRALVAEVLCSHGSISYAKQVAEQNARTARSALECLPDTEYRTILENLTDWSIRREK